MLLLRKGCCCCKLKTCVLVQGYLYVILAILNITLVSYISLNLPRATVDTLVAEEPRWKMGGAWTIIAFVFAAVSLLLAGLLLVGAYTEKRGLLMAYMIVAAIEIVASLFFQITSVVFMPSIGTVINVILSGVNLYAWIHVRSYYHELKDQEGLSKTSVSPSSPSEQTV